MPQVNTQSNWRWCSQCQGLWFAGLGNLGACAGGAGLHSPSAANYTLVVNSPSASGQRGWRWCAKCQGLWYGGRPSDRSWCPYDEGAHTFQGSSEYYLGLDAPDADAEHGWRWCSQCQGLWYGDGATRGRCPRFGAPHSLAGSSDYALARLGPPTPVAPAPVAPAATRAQRAQVASASQRRT